MSTDIKINYKIVNKLVLPNDGYVVSLPKEFDTETREGNKFVVYQCIIRKRDSINIYAETGLMIPKEETVTNGWKQNIGRYIEKKINTNTYGKGYKYFDQSENLPPINKKVIVHKEVSADTYAKTYLKITTTCVLCETSTTVIGNDNFQKSLFQIPGSKNMTYACSSKCKNNFKDHMKAINGTTTKEVRKRYHKAMYEDVYGYIYGIYNKKEHKWYVGKVGRSPFARWEEHLMKNKILANMKIEDLRFEILETVKTTGIGDADIQTLWNAELKWIAEYDSYHNGYNIQMPTKYLKRETIGNEDITNEELYRKIVGEE